MGMFKGHSYFPGPRPRPNTAPPQPETAPDEPLTKYVINGMFNPDGSYVVPEVLVVELTGGRTIDRPGQVLEMNRSEASVLMKRLSLTPVAPE